MVEKIISGGQTGVDTAGLLAAKALGLETGGWMPKGFRRQDGNNPEMAAYFGSEEHDDYGYPGRTWFNVYYSDATLQMFTDPTSAGERLTTRYILELTKPVYIIDLRTYRFEEHKVKFLAFIASLYVYQNKRVLNVAGNSELTSPGITAKATYVLLELLTYVKDSVETFSREPRKAKVRRG